MTSFKTMQDLFLSRSSNFIDDEEFFVLSDLFEWKTPTFRTKLFNFQLE